MSERSLDPEFVAHCQQALAQVSTKDVGPITADRPLADLGLDSISMAELVIQLEDMLNVTLDQKEVEGLQTFGELEELIRKVRAQA